MKINMSRDARLLVVMLIIIGVIACLFGRSDSESDAGLQLLPKTHVIFHQTSRTKGYV